MVVRDSSLPDLPNNDWGGRFDKQSYSPAQIKRNKLETFFITNSGVPEAVKCYNTPEIIPRIPKDCFVVDSAFPFPKEDIDVISTVPSWYKNELTLTTDPQTRELIKRITLFPGIVISWLTNGDIFDKSATWMTEEQKESSFTALRKLTIAAAELSSKTNREIILILPAEVIDLAQTYISSYSIIKRVITSAYPTRSPNISRKTVLAFDYLVGNKGLLVGRTAQTNAIYQALLMPNVKVAILTAPSKNYMNTPTTDISLRQYGVPVETANSLASKVLQMLEQGLETKLDSNLVLSQLNNNSFDSYVKVIAGISQ